MINNSPIMQPNNGTHKPKIFLLVFIVFLILGLAIIIATSGLLGTNTTDNSNSINSYNVTEDSIDEVALATTMDADFSDINELPQTGESCFVPTPNVTCSPVPTGAVTPVPTSAVTVVPTSGVTGTPTPTLGYVIYTLTPKPVVTVDLIKISSTVYLTVLGNCSSNTKGFRVQQVLKEGPTEWSIKNAGSYTTEGRSWTFGPTTNVRMVAMANQPYSVFRSHLQRYPIWMTKSIVYQQFTKGSDVAISPYMYSGAIPFSASSMTSTGVNLQVTCR